MVYIVVFSLRTSLCVRFKGEVVACGVIFVAARKLGVPLPEDPPWWLLFNTDITQIRVRTWTLCHVAGVPSLEPSPSIWSDCGFDDCGCCLEVLHRRC
jgi:hypothetical protein